MLEYIIRCKGGIALARRRYYMTTLHLEVVFETTDLTKAVFRNKDIPTFISGIESNPESATVGNGGNPDATTSLTSAKHRSCALT